MRTKIPLTKKQEKVADQIVFLDEHLPEKGWENIPQPIPLEVILAKCVEAWKVPADRIKGKFAGGNAVERLSKESFLFACRLFNASSSVDVRAFIGYYRLNKSGRHKWRISGNLHGMIYPLSNRSTHCHPIASFIESLVELAPERFSQLLSIAQQNKAASEAEEKRSEEKARRCVNEMKVQPREFAEIEKTLLDNLRVINKVLETYGINTRVSFESVEKPPSNRFFPVWQARYKNSIKHINDPRIKGNRYELWEVETPARKGYHWTSKKEMREIEDAIELRQN